MTHHRTPSAPTLAAISLLLAGALAPARAQDSPAAQGPAASPEPLPTIPVAELKSTPPDDAKERAETPVALQEVVVTATKRAVSAREIPVSINAIKGESLEKMGARDIQDYIATIPGITLQESPNGDAGGRKFTVRGVGPSEVSGVSGNQTVGQFIGDVPMTDPYSNFVTPDLDPFDLQTVEVLKGPQGTYFGASALNGAVRYVPNKPRMERLGWRGFAEALDIKDGSLNGTYASAINAPLGEHLAVRATGVLQNTPGYVDNLRRNDPDADSRRKWSLRGGLRWQPTDELDINLMVLKQQARKNDVLDVTSTDGELTNDRRPGPSTIESGFDLASADARYTFDDWGTLVLQSSLQHKDVRSDLDLTPDPSAESLRGFSTADIKGWTHELRLVSPDGGNWSWIAGLFYLDYSAYVFTDAYVVGTASPIDLVSLPVLGPILSPIVDPIVGPRGLSYGTNSVDPDARETSLYGELTRRLGDAWELTAGARLYKTHITGTAVSGGALGTIVPDSAIDLRDQGISPKFSLAYKPSRSFMTYATIARGFQFGGINNNVSGLPFNNPLTGPPVPPSFKSSSLWSREIGIRSDWFKRALRADLVVYDLDWRDAQFVEKNDNLVIDTTYVSNVGKVRSRGAEGNLTWRTPLKGLTLSASAGYSRAVTAVSYTAQDGSVVMPGTAMPNTPRWQTSGTVSYDRRFGTWAGAASLTHTYTSRAYDTITHDHEIFDYQALSAMFSLSRPGVEGKPALSFGISNIENARGVVGRSSFAGVGGQDMPSYIYIRPRSYTLRLSFDLE